MFKNKILRNPIVVSTFIAILLAATFSGIYLLWLSDHDRLYLWLGLGIIATFYAIFQFSLWFKKRNNLKAHRLETEEETLSMVLSPLLTKAGKTPIYLLICIKKSGRSHFLYRSIAITHMDLSLIQK